jgi:hypothetical protein
VLLAEARVRERALCYHRREFHSGIEDEEFKDHETPILELRGECLHADGGAKLGVELSGVPELA